MDIEMKNSNSSKLEHELKIASTIDLKPLDPALQHSLELLDQRILCGIHEAQQNIIREIKMGYTISKVAKEGISLSLTGMLRRKRSSLTASTSHDACQREIATLEKSIDELFLKKEQWSYESESSEKSTKDSDQDFQELQGSHQNLEMQNRKITEQLHQYEERYQIAEEQLQEFSEEKTRLECRLAELEQQNRKLEERTATFRDIILKYSNSGGEPVDTTRILVEFSGLRSQIQKIVCSKSFQVDPACRPQATRNTTHSQRDLIQCWEDGLSEPELKNRIREVIFLILNSAILSKPCFGLDDSSTGGEMENGLANFEMALNKISRGYEPQIAEWRAHTIKCAGLFETLSSKPTAVAQKIQEFLAPIVPHTIGRSSRNPNDRLHDSFVRLCRDAFNLTLLLRGTKDSYRIEFPEAGSNFDPEDVEPQAWEGCKHQSGLGSEKATIAFSLSGALVKYPEHSPKERLVLEKAHVVLHGPGHKK